MAQTTGFWMTSRVAPTTAAYVSVDPSAPGAVRFVPILATARKVAATSSPISAVLKSVSETMIGFLLAGPFARTNSLRIHVRLGADWWGYRLFLSFGGAFRGYKRNFIM